MEAMLREKPWWRELRAVKEGRLFAVDANSFFSRPSPRLLEASLPAAALGIPPARAPVPHSVQQSPSTTGNDIAEAITAAITCSLQ